MRRAFASAVVLVLVACGGSDGETTSPAPSSSAPSTTERATTTSPPTTASPAAACVESWSARQQVGQLLAIAVNGQSLASEAERVADLGVGAVFLQNPGASGLASGIAAIQEGSPIPPLVAVDEEGGEVQTLGPIVGPLPSPSDMAASATPEEAEQRVAQHAQAVADLGVDVVFGPLADVAAPGGSGPLGARVFSDDPATVSAYVAAYVRGFQSAGVLPVLKHFPGHGGATGDSHDGPVDVAPLPALQARDLRPFVDNLSSDVGVMVGHLAIPGFTGLEQASQSPPAIAGLLRQNLGFTGLVFTDSLSMGAVAFDTPPHIAAVRAIRAGADVALFVSLSDPSAVLDAMEAALETGELPQQRVTSAVLRVLAAKGVDPCAV